MLRDDRRFASRRVRRGQRPETRREAAAEEPGGWWSHPWGKAEAAINDKHNGPIRRLMYLYTISECENYDDILGNDQCRDNMQECVMTMRIYDTIRVYQHISSNNNPTITGSDSDPFNGNENRDKKNCTR